jgi:hypothetical protein
MKEQKLYDDKKLKEIMPNYTNFAKLSEGLERVNQLNKRRIVKYHIKQYRLFLQVGSNNAKTRSLKRKGKDKVDLKKKQMS